MRYEAFLADTPESLGIDPTRLDALLTRAEKEVAEGLLPSVQIAVARRGKLAAVRSFGQVTTGGRRTEATPDTLYTIFSSTKAITSAAAWLLIQEGKLDVSERVVDIVPEFGSNGKEVVTVEQLFTHTAGFPEAPFRPEQFLDREARLARFASWRLAWEPGSRFHYHPSSSMYVIAELIERRSGERYGDFVRRRIAEPLGLESLWTGLPHALHGELADIEYVGREPTDEEYAELGFPKPPVTEVTEENVLKFNSPAVREAGIPGGGGTMTAADLALFYQALLTGCAPDGTRIWSEETLADARRIRNPDFVDPVFRKPANRGLGVTLSGDAERNYRGFGHTNSPDAFGHGGAGGQIAWADPETGLSLGYCTNGFDRNPIRLARRGIGISSRAAALVG